MNILPIITRELRGSARRASTIWLRVSGALICVMVLALVSVEGATSPVQIGSELFASLHRVTVAAIWVMVPLMVSDTIAAERRDGTLGLLFLTPLTPAGVVAGKVVVHLIRALTLWIGTFPILAIPLLLGGVSTDDLFVAMVFQGCSLVLALSAGMMASSLTRDRMWAAVLAVGIGGIFLAGLSGGGNGLPGSTPKAMPVVVMVPMPNGVGMAGTFLTTPTGAPVMAPPPPNPPVSWWPQVVTIILTLAAAALSFRFVVLRTARSWKDKVATPAELWLDRTFCSTRFLPDLLRAKMTRALENNPVGWLHQFSWKGRMTKWGWALFMVIAQTWAIIDFDYFPKRAMWGFLILLGGMAFSSASSFREEKQSGAFELILVTPIRERELSWGRFWGIVGQFVPAILIAGLTGLIYLSVPASIWRNSGWLAYWDRNPDVFAAEAVFVGVALFGMPWLGMRLSLTRLHPTLAATATLLIWVTPAVVLSILFDAVLTEVVSVGVVLSLALLAQIFIFLVCEFGVEEVIRERRFIQRPLVG